MNRIKQLTAMMSGALALGLFALSGMQAEAADVPIDATTFPDDTFRTYVSSNIDTDSDGSLSTAEIEAVTQIDCSRSMIGSLKGVEHFIALERLVCYDNELDELDVTTNTVLTYLDCKENRITSLDVSQNRALTYLDCTENQLTVLDVSQNIALENLYCTANSLTSLDVRSNIALKELHCGENGLTALDVSQNAALENLYCKDNQLTALDVSANPALEWLGCSRNDLTSLDVSRNPALESLLCRNNALTSLELGSNNVLSMLYCMYNQLTSLDVRDCPKIRNAVLNGTKVDTNGYVKYDLAPCLFIVDSTVTVITDDPSYTVSFVAGGGTGNMAAVTVTEGAAYTLPENGFTAASNKEFDKWDLGKPGDTITVTADTVVTAQWKDKAEDAGGNEDGSNAQEGETDRDKAENEETGDQDEDVDEEEVNVVLETAVQVVTPMKSPKTQDQSGTMLWMAFLFAGVACRLHKGGKHEYIGKH